MSAEEEALRFALSRQFPHLTPPHTAPHFGTRMGCIAWKKIITITAFGDVLPCIWIYYSLGNIFEEPLAAILARGGKYFGHYHHQCRTNRDEEFMDEYMENTRGRDLPVRIEEVLYHEDMETKGNFLPRRHEDERQFSTTKTQRH